MAGRKNGRLRWWSRPSRRGRAPRRCHCHCRGRGRGGFTSAEIGPRRTAQPVRENVRRGERRAPITCPMGRAQQPAAGRSCILREGGDGRARQLPESDKARAAGCVDVVTSVTTHITSRLWRAARPFHAHVTMTASAATGLASPVTVLECRRPWPRFRDPFGRGARSAPRAGLVHHHYRRFHGERDGAPGPRRVLASRPGLARLGRAGPITGLLWTSSPRPDSCGAAEQTSRHLSPFSRR